LTPLLAPQTLGKTLLPLLVSLVRRQRQGAALPVEELCESVYVLGHVHNAGLGQIVNMYESSITINGSLVHKLCKDYGNHVSMPTHRCHVIPLMCFNVVLQFGAGPGTKSRQAPSQGQAVAGVRVV
jgi:hypothetical protein